MTLPLQKHLIRLVGNYNGRPLYVLVCDPTDPAKKMVRLAGNYDGRPLYVEGPCNMNTLGAGYMPLGKKLMRLVGQYNGRPLYVTVCCGRAGSSSASASGSEPLGSESISASSSGSGSESGSVSESLPSVGSEAVSLASSSASASASVSGSEVPSESLPASLVESVSSSSGSDTGTLPGSEAVSESAASSGSGSSGSGSGGTLTDCCPGVAIPDTLYITITNQVDEYLCYPDVAIPANKISAFSWQTRPITECFGSNNLTVGCFYDSGTGRYRWQMSGFARGGAAVYADDGLSSCDPFELVFLASVGGPFPGSATFTVTF